MDSSYNPELTNFYLIPHCPDDILAEVAIGPLSRQETGVQSLHFRISKSDILLQNSFSHQVDPTGLRQWKTLAFECSCGTTWINSNSESWKGFFAFLVHQVDAFDLDHHKRESAQLKMIFALIWPNLIWPNWPSWTGSNKLGWIGFHPLHLQRFTRFLTSQSGPPVNVICYLICSSCGTHCEKYSTSEFFERYSHGG